jgi:hypothetical protein
MLRSPVAAMLWENWRLTRVEAAQRLVQGIVLAAAVLAGFAAVGAAGNNAARLALGLVVMTFAPLSLSVARLNGGRFIDGYRPGYPFRFLYTRPVPTSVLVGAPMAALVVSAVAVYIVAALVLRSAFGVPFPLLPLAAWIAAFLVLSGFYARPATRMVAVVTAMFSLPAVLILGGNAFGIRARHGRTFASTFEATQAYGTARMAGLKVLVRSVCLIAALTAVGTSIWTSASSIPFDVLEDNDTFIEKSRSPVSGWMRALDGAVGAMSGYQLSALAFVAAIAVVVMVAFRAALPALRARYPRRVNTAGSLLLLLGLVLVLRAPDGQGGNGWDVLFMDAFFRAAPWMAAAAIALATVSLFWRVLAEQLLTPRQALVAVLIWAAFGAAWVTVLRAAGVPLGGPAPVGAVWMLSPALLPLLASVLAPWSLSRVRHT